MTEVGIENVNLEQGQNSKYMEYIGTQKKYQKVFWIQNLLIKMEVVFEKKSRSIAFGVLNQARPLSRFLLIDQIHPLLEMS